jgi:hypothetical protein
MRRGAPVLAVAALVAGLAGAATALARPADRFETATAGAYAAKVRFGVAGIAPRFSIRSLHLHVTRAGAPVLDRDLPLPRGCRDLACVLVTDLGVEMVEVRSLGRPTPTVVLWLWTGGAHCCSVVEAVDVATGVVGSQDFGNGGAVVDRFDGEVLFRAQDERFPYLYTSYAASGEPIALFRWQAPRFVDVTADHPAAIRADAAEWWKAYVAQRNQRSEGRGVFAAWAADVCRLGNRAKVEATLADGVGRGFFSRARSEDFGPYDAKYASVLLRDLGKWGYCPR